MIDITNYQAYFASKQELKEEIDKQNALLIDHIQACLNGNKEVCIQCFLMHEHIDALVGVYNQL